jgi:hypothetical protein
VPTVLGSNILINANRHRDSSITHWNIVRGSAGLWPFYFGGDFYPAVLVAKYIATER